MIDYIVHHVGADGSLRPKVFKLSTRDLREHLLSRIARLAREDAEHRALAAAASDEGDDDRAAEEEAEAAHCTTAILCFREVLDLLP